MNSESSLLPSTGTISRDIHAIWPGALLTAYLGVTGLLLAFGAGPTPWGGLALHLVALAVVATATWLPKLRLWVRRWTPLLLALFFYSELPLLITAAGHATVYDTTVIAWEHAIFGGQPAADWAARWRSRALSELLHAAYISYYAVIFAVPLLLERQRRHAEASRAIFVLMLTFVACFATYVAFPVAGPRYLWTSAADDVGGLSRLFATWVLESQSSRGTAFPSSHVAVSMTQAALAVVYFGRRGLIVAVIAVLLAIGAVYGGFHYLIDVVAGLGYALVFTTLGLWLSALGARPDDLKAESRKPGADQAKATAPT